MPLLIKFNQIGSATREQGGKARGVLSFLLDIIDYHSSDVFLLNNILAIIEMIVPDFKLRQNDTHLLVYIRVPYIKVSACEFYIEAKTFKFYLKPYLLSLNLEQPLKEVEEPTKAIYYHEKYLLEVHLEKATPSEVFENLDLLTNILNNKKKTKKKPKMTVEVLNQEGKVVVEEEERQLCQLNYGFGMNYSNVLDNLEEEANQLFQFDPRSTRLAQRYQLSREILLKHFDIDSYLYDKHDNQEEITCVLADRSWLTVIEEKMEQFNGSSVNSAEYKLKMSGKEVLISKSVEENLFKEIISIVFSYLHEQICMCGQMGVESAKTINQTSLVLSCHSYYTEMSLQQVILDCSRRCITYSLYKSLPLCRQILKCLIKMLDVRYFILILMELKDMFEKNDPRYLLNRLFLDDYLVYLFSFSTRPPQFEDIEKQLSKVDFTQNDFEFGIAEYEKMQEQEEEEGRVQAGEEEAKMQRKEEGQMQQEEGKMQQKKEEAPEETSKKVIPEQRPKQEDIKRLVQQLQSLNTLD